MKQTNIFIINGFPTVGKDYFTNTIGEYGGNGVENISTVDVVKKAMTNFGYVEHDPQIKQKFRNLLSNLKDDVDAQLNDWTSRNCIDRAISAIEFGRPIFIHCREPKKIDLMKTLAKEQGYEVRTLLIEADWYKQTEFTCHADENVLKYDYDIKFMNTKDVSTFNQRIVEFFDDHIIK